MERGTSDVMLMIRIFRHGVKRTIYLRLGVIQIRIFSHYLGHAYIISYQVNSV